MRRRSVLLTVAATLALGPASAQAHRTHTVQPGETLWSIAQANGLPVATVAAASGLPADAQVVAATTVTIPDGHGGQAPAGGGETGAGGGPAPAGQAASGAPGPLGAYTVRPGDTLSGLAAQAGVSVAAMAAMNGLDPAAPLLSGTAIKLPTGAPAPARAAAPAPRPQVVPAAEPAPAPGRVTADQVGGVAAEHGVPASLAAAIAWQESGFNNAMVSSANARGVMQVMPGTWDWVQGNLATRALDPASAMDNVHAGTMYLGRMLEMAGGDAALAAAGYYQGMASVRRIGMLPETRRYVDNVLALRSRFGG